MRHMKGAWVIGVIGFAMGIVMHMIVSPEAPANINNAWVYQILREEHALGVGYVTNIIVVGTTNTLTINITR